MLNPEVEYYVEYRIENKDVTGSHTYSRRITKEQYDFYKDKIGYETDHIDMIKRIESVYILNDIDVNKELCEIIDQLNQIENRVDNDTFETFTQEIIDYLEDPDGYLSRQVQSELERDEILQLELRFDA